MVYQGLNMVNGQLIAVKTVKLTGNSITIQKEAESLKQEIQLLKQLKHKNIVKYMQSDVSLDKTGIDIILEYVPGGSIRSLLNKFKRFDEQLAHIYVRQILEGLHYLHSNQIIHRDLKCANVLVDNDGTIKLSDFGASKKIQNEMLNTEMNKSLKGSPYWMAPEIISRTGHGKAVDIWSVGCCVIEMLTSQPPWSSISKNAKVILNVIKDTETLPPEFPQNISNHCNDFIIQCLQRDPSKRPTCEQLLKHPFVQTKYTQPKIKPQQEIVQQVFKPNQISYDQPQKSKIINVDPYQRQLTDFDQIAYGTSQVTPSQNIREQRYVPFSQSVQCFQQNQRPVESMLHYKLQAQQNKQDEEKKAQRQQQRLLWEEELQNELERQRLQK